MGYMDKWLSRMQGLGHGHGSPSLGDRDFGFSGVALGQHPNECNARHGYSKGPAFNPAFGTFNDTFIMHTVFSCLSMHSFKYAS
jgi:hypothetical protein